MQEFLERQRGEMKLTPFAFLLEIMSCFYEKR